MTLEWALSDAGIDPKKDVNIDTSVAFSAMSSAFIGGTGDFVALFEPNALELEKEGYGYVVASLGELGGVVPYTAFFARVYTPESLNGIQTTEEIEDINFGNNNGPRKVKDVLE